MTSEPVSINQNEITTPNVYQRRVRIVRSSLWIAEHWVLLFSIFYGIVMILPFLAPVFMHLGWTSGAQAIYSMYSLLCHQMAQRCFFLFGKSPMYNAAQLPIPLSGYMDTDMLAVRAFAGNADMGWKVAWSDRMVYMYGAVWIAGMIYGLLHQRKVIKPLHWLGFIALLAPMGIDGGTHWVSDMVGGLASGFRYDNVWLANLTHNAFPSWFYYGDALGSFNSWMRLITGILFGIAFVWFAFPFLDQSMREVAIVLRNKLQNSRFAQI